MHLGSAPASIEALHVGDRIKTEPGTNSSNSLVQQRARCGDSNTLGWPLLPWSHVSLPLYELCRHHYVRM